MGVFGRSFSLGGVLFLFFSSSAPASPLPSSQSSEEKETPEAEEAEAEDEEDAKGPSEEQLRVFELFSATSKRFEQGRIVLTYDFQGQDESSVKDWSPAVDRSMKSRLHWTSQGEMDQLEAPTGYGYSTARSRLPPEGLILADFGQFIHKAVFLSDVAVEVDMINTAHPRAGTILGPFFYSEKKKMFIGVNSGSQAMCLSGLKPKKTPIPKEEKAIPLRTRQNQGFKLKGKVLECYLNGRKTCDTAQVPGFIEGIETGQAALAWNGSVKAYVNSVTITGRLDPSWVSRQMAGSGDKPAEKSKETSGPRGGSKKS